MSDGSQKDSKKKNRASFGSGSLMVGIGLALAVLILVATVFFLLTTAKVVDPVALRVEGREVSRAQYDEYVTLGKQTGSSEKLVKAAVIEYEKNRVAAEQHKIELPETYIALSRDDMLARTAEQGGAIEKLRAANDDLTKLRLYNAAFTNYLGQSSRGGWSLVLYDVPVIASLDPAASVKRAHDSAVSLHDQLVGKQITAPAAVQAAKQLNIGQPAQTGLYFITEADGSVFGPYSGGVYTRLLDPDFIREQVRGKQPGISEVKDYNGQSAYFVDLLYTQKKQENLMSTVEKEKVRMKVVDYVNQ